jgi:hypothetical protein
MLAMPGRGIRAGSGAAMRLSVDFVSIPRDSPPTPVPDRFLTAGWVKRLPRGRAVRVTDAGRAALAEVFGIDWT